MPRPNADNHYPAPTKPIRSVTPKTLTLLYPARNPKKKNGRTLAATGSAPEDAGSRPAPRGDLQAGARRPRVASVEQPSSWPFLGLRGFQSFCELAVNFGGGCGAGCCSRSLGAELLTIQFATFHGFFILHMVAKIRLIDLCTSSCPLFFENFCHDSWGLQDSHGTIACNGLGCSSGLNKRSSTEKQTNESRKLVDGGYGAGQLYPA